LSLKEALDAAHGHEHAEDGSELTQQSKKPVTSSSIEGGGQSRFWMSVSAILFVLLLFVVARRKSRHVE